MSLRIKCYNKSTASTTIYGMDLNLKHSGIFIILFLIYFSNIKSEYFNNDTKSLKILNEQTKNLDCIRVQLYNMDNYVFNLVLNMKIPITISNGWNSYRKRVHISLCPNFIIQLNSIYDLKPVLDSCATHRGIIFILFNHEIDWHQICEIGNYFWLTQKMYRVFYITTEHSKFYHPFLIENGKYGAMADTDKYKVEDLFHSLNGYPIRVYIFDSVFSNVKAKKDTFKVTRVEGVDAKVAYLLEEIFNFTMQLQWPDDDFFG